MVLTRAVVALMQALYIYIYTQFLFAQEAATPAVFMVLPLTLSFLHNVS